MGVRDIAEKITVLSAEDLSLASAGGSVTSTPIEVKDFDRGLMYAVEPDDTIGNGEIEYEVELSDDASSAGTYTTAPEGAYSPPFKQEEDDRLLEDPQNGRQQPIGVNCSARWARLKLTTNVASTAAQTITATPVLAPEYNPDRAWTSSDVNPGDDLP